MYAGGECRNEVEERKPSWEGGWTLAHVRTVPVQHPAAKTSPLSQRNSALAANGSAVAEGAAEKTNVQWPLFHT